MFTAQNTIWVSGLPDGVEDHEVRDLFEDRCGAVDAVKILPGSFVGRQPFCFLTFRRAVDFEYAIETFVSGPGWQAKESLNLRHDWPLTIKQFVYKERLAGQSGNGGHHHSYDSAQGSSSRAAHGAQWSSADRRQHSGSGGADRGGESRGGGQGGDDWRGPQPCTRGDRDHNHRSHGERSERDPRRPAHMWPDLRTYPSTEAHTPHKKSH
mmetsp:Transcript_162185/g.515269  ORF Transcript_162185/g.515269 Transcript_162185/m.515269 type:complete len:210 (+) Transcript_162185:79-708(+)